MKSKRIQQSCYTCDNLMFDVTKEEIETQRICGCRNHSGICFWIDKGKTLEQSRKDLLKGGCSDWTRDAEKQLSLF